jgi:hypothetical protein
MKKHTCPGPSSAEKYLSYTPEFFILDWLLGPKSKV